MFSASLKNPPLSNTLKRRSVIPPSLTLLSISLPVRQTNFYLIFE